MKKYILVEEERAIDTQERKQLKRKGVKIDAGITFMHDGGTPLVLEIFDKEENALKELEKYKSSIWSVNDTLYVKEYYVQEVENGGSDENEDWDYLDGIEFTELNFGVIWKDKKIASFDSLDDAENFLEDLEYLIGLSDYEERNEVFVELEIEPNTEKYENHYEGKSLDIRKVSKEMYQKCFEMK